MPISVAKPTTRAAEKRDAASTPGALILEASSLKKTYRLGRVDVPVLKGASLAVRERECIAILGASGSGKSTLLHLIGDLDRPDRSGGDVKFRGQNVHRLSRRARNDYRNRSVGFVFQFYHLLPELTVLENTMLPALVSKRRAVWAQLLLAAGILPGIIAERLVYAKVSKEPRERAAALLESFGLGHRLKHRPRELSGGERQRVAIARALINDPEVLLADEPTGNLDEKTGREILALLDKQHEDGLTIVMVTHDRAVAERADRIVELRDGMVVNTKD